MSILVHSQAKHFIFYVYIHASAYTHLHHQMHTIKPAARTKRDAKKRKQVTPLSKIGFNRHGPHSQYDGGFQEEEPDCDPYYHT